MPKPKVSNAKPKKYKPKVKDVKDTSRAKKGCPLPTTKLWINVEEGIKKDKEVKEKDVFDFSYSKIKNPVKR